MLESFFGFFFLAKNYSCHFWHFPIIFASHSILSFLYSVLKVLVGFPPLVGSNGLEPSTSRLSGVRSNHLSYEPISVAGSFPIGQTCWWRRTESNCRPPACKAGALPAELRPRIRFVPLGKSTLLSSQRALKIKQCKTY